MAIQRIDTGGFVMNAELSGPAGAPVVCLNHCFAADHGYWDAHLPALEGFRVLRYDTRGHGDSDAPPGPYTLEMLADDVARLCDVLGVDRVHFCGVSLGGQIAQTFALNHPQRVASLTIVNSTCEYSAEQAQQWRARAELAQRGGMQAVHDALLARWFTDEAAQRKIPGYRYMDAVLRRFTADSFSAASEAMCGLDTTARLAQIAVPSMVVATSDDPGASPEVSRKMARLIPDCELHWLEPASHLASLEHPERFNDLLRSFLKKQLS